MAIGVDNLFALELLGMDEETVLRLVQRTFPEKIHFKAGENTSGCQMTGDRTSAQVWGEYLTTRKIFVGCKPCIELIHA